VGGCVYEEELSGEERDESKDGSDGRFNSLE